jgi:hypothetical protein
MVELLLRLNLARENDWVESTAIQLSTIVFSANVMETFFRTSIRTINSLKKPYVIDPLTAIFGIESLDPSPKRWFSKLVSHYGLDLILSQGTTTIPVDRLIGSNTATKELKDFVENVIEYQRQRILDSPEYGEFVDVENFEGRVVDDGLFTPRFLIPPYFYVGYDLEYISDVVDSQWLKVNAESVRHAVTVKREKEMLCPVVLVSKSLLTFPDQVEKLVSAYNIVGVDGYFIWVSDFHENREPETVLKGFVSLVEAFAKLGKPVYNFYGGIFSFLINKLGLTGVSHSICYGDYKDPFAEPGILATIRFYDRDLGTKVPYGKVQELLHLTGRESCSCEYCQQLDKVVGQDRSARGKRIEYVGKHFLRTRSEEVAILNNADAEDFMNRFDDIRKILDQRDTIGAYRDFYQHLALWNKVLRDSLPSK